MKYNHITLRILLAIAIIFAFSKNSVSQNPYWRLGGNNLAGPDIINAANNTIGSLAGINGIDVGINFMTYGTNRMFINQNASSGTFGGYVGIGAGFLPNSVNEPLSRLHIGNPDPQYTINGWRPWMKEGVFIHKGSDIAYFGLMDTSSSDRQDAIIAWGDNSTDETSSFGPDFLRIIFDQKNAGSWANGYYGKEVMRFVPDGRIGMGTIFNPAVLPSAHVEINDNGSTPIIGVQPQLQLSYNHGTEYANFQVFSNGHLNINPVGGGTFTKVGIGNGFSAVNVPGAKLDVLDVNTQLRLTYSLIGTVKTDFFTNNSGYLSILPSGSRVGINTSASPAANLEVRGSTAALEQLRLTNYTNNNINTRLTTNSNGYFLFDATGNRFGFETTSPNNTVEINSAVSNTSGLRFTQLNSASPVTAGNSKVLSVDANGDVVLVNDNGAGSLSFCSGSPTVNGGFHTLWSDWASKQICFSGEVYEQYGDPYGNYIGIGTTGSWLGKIHYKVNPSWTGSKVAFYLENPLYLGTGLQINCTNNSSTGIYSSGGTYGVSGYATGVPSGGGGTVNGVKGDANGNNNTQASPAYTNGNAGVFGIVSASQSVAWNAGVEGLSQVNQTGVTNNGTFGLATGGTTAVGAYGWGSAATNSYGVKGETQGNSNNQTVENYAGYFVGDAKITHDLFVVGTPYNIGGSGMWSTSDEILKQSIEAIDGAKAMDWINNLKPSSYYFDTLQFKDLNLPQEEQFGFIAQDVETIFPNMVRKIAITNDLSVDVLNYQEFIAILTAGLKQESADNDGLQTQITDLQTKLDALQLQVDGCCNNGMRLQDQGGNPVQHISLMSETVALLGDCVPNPNGGKTKITVRIPLHSANAEIIFTDQLGKEVSRFSITNRGYTDLEIETSHLENGVYHYSLIVDGKLIDTKQMLKQQ